MNGAKRVKMQPSITGQGCITNLTYRFGFIEAEGLDDQVYFEHDATQNAEPDLTLSFRLHDTVIFTAVRTIHMKKSKRGGPMRWVEDWRAVPGSVRVDALSSMQMYQGKGTIHELAQWEGWITPDDSPTTRLLFSAHCLPRKCSHTKAVVQVGDRVRYSWTQNGAEQRVHSVEKLDHYLERARVTNTQQLSILPASRSLSPAQVSPVHDNSKSDVMTIIPHSVLNGDAPSSFGTTGSVFWMGMDTSVGMTPLSMGLGVANMSNGVYPMMSGMMSTNRFRQPFLRMPESAQVSARFMTPPQQRFTMPSTESQLPSCRGPQVNSCRVFAPPGVALLRPQVPPTSMTLNITSDGSGMHQRRSVRVEPREPTVKYTPWTLKTAKKPEHTSCTVASKDGHDLRNHLNRNRKDRGCSNLTTMTMDDLFDPPRRPRRNRGKKRARDRSSDIAASPSGSDEPLLMKRKVFGGGKAPSTSQALAVTSDFGLDTPLDDEYDIIFDP